MSDCVEKVIPAESLLALFGTTESAVDRCLRLDLPRAHVTTPKGERVLTPEGLAAAASSTYGHKLACTQIFLVPVVEHLTKILCTGKGLFIGENPIGRPGYASRQLKVVVDPCKVVVTKFLRAFDPKDETNDIKLGLKICLYHKPQQQQLSMHTRVVVCL